MIFGGAASDPSCRGMSDPLSVPLPVLTTHRPDRRDRGYLAWVAVANEIAHLPLDSAPVDAIPHALEIHVSGIDEPLVVIAEPMGPPTDQGFPLRLRPLDDAHEAAAEPPAPEPQHPETGEAEGPQAPAENNAQDDLFGPPRQRR